MNSSEKLCCTPLQKEVCNKCIENNLLKPTDVIDYTYSNSRLSEIKQGWVKTKNSENNQIMCTLTTNAMCFGICIEVDD
jgi:hypothetical protein